jgi:hypothetical protein
MNPPQFKDEQLRDAFVMDAELQADGADCPPAETILESARGELPAAEDEKVLYHVGECGACAAAWRLARELAEEKVPVGAPHRARGPTIPTWGGWLAAAAVLVLAVALGVQFLGPSEIVEEPVYRAQEGDWLLLEGADGETLPREGFLLRWSDGPEGSTYNIRVMTEELDLVAEARSLERSEFQVPPSALSEFPSGARIFWQVTAHLPDGRRIDSDSFLAVVE